MMTSQNITFKIWTLLSFSYKNLPNSTFTPKFATTQTKHRSYGEGHSAPPPPPPQGYEGQQEVYAWKS